jgi:predicted secreted protein
MCLVPSLLSAVAQYATWATVFGFVPILARQYGASDVLQGILVSMNIGVVALGNVITTAVIRGLANALLYLSFMILGGHTGNRFGPVIDLCGRSPVCYRAFHRYQLSHS